MRGKLTRATRKASAVPNSFLPSLLRAADVSWFEEFCPAPAVSGDRKTAATKIPRINFVIAISLIDAPPTAETFVSLGSAAKYIGNFLLTQGKRDRCPFHCGSLKHAVEYIRREAASIGQPRLPNDWNCFQWKMYSAALCHPRLWMVINTRSDAQN
jgi:hypothetical protein